MTEMSLPPGRYQLRVAGGPTVGTAERDLRPRHPELHKDSLAMSGVALTSSTAEETVTVWPSAARPLNARLPSPITVTRILAGGDCHPLRRGVREWPASGLPIDFRVDLGSATGRVMSTFTAQQPSTAATQALAASLLRQARGRRSRLICAPRGGNVNRRREDDGHTEIPIRVR